MSRLCCLFLIVLGTGRGVAQSVSTSDPQALALAAQSVAALTGGSAISDTTLNGTVTRIAGSDQEIGTVTLLAKGSSESRADLNLSGGTRSEIRNSITGVNRGNWIGTNGVVHPVALHNCLTDASWFFPALGTLASAAGKPSMVFSYVGLENVQQASLQHIQAYTVNASFSEATQLSTMDFYLDAKTLLPSIIAFDEHPDNDQTVDIAVAVAFSDYRNVNGAMIPFHIQRYVYNGLTLDIQLASAGINSGIPDSQFKLQ
jgi:hypothetical protein